MSVLFISETTLKEKSYILDNVDMKVVTPTIFMVQDVYLHPILGTQLFNDIKARIEAGTVASGSPVYTTLLDIYIQPTLIWYIQAELPLLNSLKLANKGLVSKNADGSQVASMSDIIKFSDSIRDKAENYAQRLTNYLIANQTTFTKYLESGEIDSISPNSTSYQSGIFLGGTDCRDCDNPYWHER